MPIGAYEHKMSEEAPICLPYGSLATRHEILDRYLVYLAAFLDLLCHVITHGATQGDGVLIFDSVVHLRAIPAAPQDAGTVQHVQLARHVRLVGPELRHDHPNGPLAIAQGVQDLQTCWFREQAEVIRHLLEYFCHLLVVEINIHACGALYL